MIIGIDGNEANISNRVGINEYAYELLRGIYKLQDEWKNRHQVYVFLKNKPLPDFPQESKRFHYQIISGSKNWVLTRLSPYLFRNKLNLDIFFSPNHYVPLFSPIPLVCSIMDLGYLEFSEQFTKRDFWQLKFWTAYSLRVSKAIIAISNSTMKDIVRHYPFASGKTFVTHLGFDSSQFNTDIGMDDVRRIKEKYSIVGDYILYLGTLKPSKNIEGLIDAYGILNSKFKIQNSKLSVPRLVIAGKKGWLYESIFSKVNKLSLNGKVIFTDYIQEQDKPALIKGAKVFCLPSFWEGFGLDVLNALASGVPVVVSDRGSLPEVVGKAGIIVNPDDCSDIADGLVKVLSASEISYNKLVQEGLERVKRFNWLKTVRETLNVIERVK
jgi:glycosyltransferase involved in cell wall biosynthesis